MTRLAGLVLAGGQGRRMGGADKALLGLAGRSLLLHVLTRLAPQLGPIALSANGPADAYQARLLQEGWPGALPVLADDIADKGPLGGVLVGLGFARSVGAAGLVTVAVDSPFFPTDLVARLSQAPGGIAHAQAGGRAHPTFALWPIEAEVGLRAFLSGPAAPRLLDYLLGIGSVGVGFPGAADFANLNTPQDLTEAEARLTPKGAAG